MFVDNYFNININKYTNKTYIQIKNRTTNLLNYRTVKFKKACFTSSF